MWYPATVTTPPATEPVTLSQAKDQCGVLADETTFDAKMALLVSSARAHAERYCNVRFTEQTLEIECDCFEDMARLPEGPIKTLTSITYTDVDGAAQTVPDTVYQLHPDGIEPSVTLKYEQVWPSIRVGSRIKLTGVFGGTTPEDVQHATMLLIGHWFNAREAVEIGSTVAKVPHAVDDLLCNHRRGI